MSEIFQGFDRLNTAQLPTPSYVVDAARLEQNLQILARIEEESGAKVLLALKAFSMYHFAPLVMRYLSGTCASGLHEARLGREEFGGEVTTFCAAYKEEDLREILCLSDHVIFNSLGQWDKFKVLALAAQQDQPNLSFGLRVNPQHSEGAVGVYNPCAAGSRLGIPVDQLIEANLDGIDGLHMHTLCEQDFPPLDRTLAVLEDKLGERLHHMKWLNLGGGHHISHEDYQVDDLIARLRDIQSKYQLQAYVEPGEAVALNAGVFVTEVLDITHNEVDLALLDCSATCHMPDVLEMPYQPHVLGADQGADGTHPYRLGGMTCLAGDVIGDYSFATPLQIGDRLVFGDMAIYSMVKTTTFNGMALPSIIAWDSRSGALEPVRSFGYEDFKSRL
ncbi:MAG: carboxynorspermidine decarboxylase [Granulosicoccaceae bacterium]